MKSENELIEDKIAYIRDNLFEEEDYISTEGYDLVGAYAGSAYEVICGIQDKIVRQQELITLLKGSLYNCRYLAEQIVEKNPNIDVNEIINEVDSILEDKE